MECRELDEKGSAGSGLLVTMIVAGVICAALILSVSILSDGPKNPSGNSRTDRKAVESAFETFNSYEKLSEETDSQEKEPEAAKPPPATNPLQPNQSDRGRSPLPIDSDGRGDLGPQVEIADPDLVTASRSQEEATSEAALQQAGLLNGEDLFKSSQNGDLAAEVPLLSEGSESGVAERGEPPIETAQSGAGIPMSKLTPPLFSLGADAALEGAKSRAVTLRNPNPSHVSRIRFSIDSGPWILYRGISVWIPPKGQIAAYCESTHPDWMDSLEVQRSYSEQPLALKPPRITASGSSSGTEAPGNVLVTVSNPNKFAVSALEYRVGDGEWQPYTGAVRLKQSPIDGGERELQARAVPIVNYHRSSDVASLRLGGDNGVPLTAAYSASEVDALANRRNPHGRTADSPDRSASEFSGETALFPQFQESAIGDTNGFKGSRARRRSEDSIGRRFARSNEGGAQSVERFSGDCFESNRESDPCPENYDQLLEGGQNSWAAKQTPFRWSRAIRGQGSSMPVLQNASPVSPPDSTLLRPGMIWGDVGLLEPTPVSVPRSGELLGLSSGERFLKSHLIYYQPALLEQGGQSDLEEACPDETEGSIEEFEDGINWNKDSVPFGSTTGSVSAGA